MLPDDAIAAVVVISMAAHTAVAALADGFDAFLRLIIFFNYVLFYTIFIYLLTSRSSRGGF